MSVISVICGALGIISGLVGGHKAMIWLIIAAVLGVASIVFGVMALMRARREGTGMALSIVALAAGLACVIVAVVNFIGYDSIHNAQAQKDLFAENEETSSATATTATSALGVTFEEIETI